ncbi:MAG: SGNH/GDSL hydrolase family protein [Burkholderiaceae bacterium]
MTRSLFAVLLVLTLIAAPFTSAFAEKSDAVADVCAAPANLGRLADELPKTRAALWAGRPLRIIALGSSSTAGAGASATRFSYPSRLAVELAQRRPAASVEIINRGLNGEDAWENVRRLQSDVIDAKPDLVIWQLGTNAILHELDYADYDHVVQEGIDRMRAAHIEILLMDLQYAPRVTEVPDHQRMLRFFDAIGARNHIPVFHRYAVMKHWSDAMRGDYPRMLSSDGLHLNDTSYGCLAERLADAIVGDASAAASRAAMMHERPVHGAHDTGR